MHDENLHLESVLCGDFKEKSRWLRHDNQADLTCVMSELSQMCVSVSMTVFSTAFAFSHSPSPGYLDDLYSFDLANLTWTRLAATAVPRPSARNFHGFTSAGGKLYVHGGSNTGNEYVGTCWVLGGKRF